MKQVWACGGGTQSAAIAGLIYEGKLPRPDYSLMVDTEREKSSTWRYVYGVIQPKLAEVGVDLVVIPKSDYASDDLFSQKGTILIPAFTNKGGSVGKLSGFCSDKWKVRVMDRWLRARGVPPTATIRWLGISVNEMSRVRSGKFRYPLIFDSPMRREDCRTYIQSIGWPLPPAGGSACWLCPNMSDRQWIEIRDSDPEDFEKACLEDEAIRLRDPNAFVHRSGRPLREMAGQLGNPGQEELFGCSSGVCFV